MNTTEFYLWLNGYLEALESEGREKMGEIKFRSQQERVVFGPNVNTPTQQGYGQQPTARK